MRAQQPLRIFEAVGVTDKGTQFYASLTKDVITDKMGRIWYGTLGSGLYRYDGYDYVHYQFDPEDTTTIDSDRVWALMESSAGDIWVVTYEGINQLDPAKGRFKRCGKPQGYGNPRAIFELDANRLLVGMDRGVFEWNIIEQRYTIWKPAGTAKSFPQVNKFYRDRSGRIWAASAAGLLLFRPDKRMYEIIAVSLPGIGKNLPCNTLFQQKDGAFLAGCDSILIQFSSDTRIFQQTSLPDTLQRFLYIDIEEGPDGSLWMACNRGLVRWRPKSGLVEHFNTPRRLYGVFPGLITAMCQDKLGNLWLATSAGLRKTNINKTNYQLYQLKIGRDVASNHPFWVMEDSQGGLLMFNGNLMFYSAGLGQEATVLTLPAGKKPMPFANHVARTPEGDVCLSWSEGGLAKWDTENKRFIDLLPASTFNEKIIHSQCYDSDDPQSVWMSTEEGVWKVDRRTWQKRLVIRADQLDNQLVEEIIEDGKGGLWLVTSSIIGYMTKITEDFELLDFNRRKTSGRYTPSELMDAVCDNQGTLWVAAIGGLVKITRSAQGSFNHHFLTTREGLPTNILNSISKDMAGYIWAGFYNAYVMRIHPQTLKWDVYDIMNPLQTQPHIRKSLSNSKTGLLFDVTQEGLVVFDPLRIRRDSTPPALTLTNIYINNMLLEGRLDDKGHLLLDPGENAITIEFAAIHMISPYSNRYQYMLIGYNQDWVTCPAVLRRASFTNLPPGQYRFMLRASNADGIWSGAETLLSFTIKPSYWQTTWFRLLLAGILAAVIYGIVANRMQQRRLKEEKRLAEQKTQYKSLFLANMSHEIRTPMNAILGLSELLEKTPLGEKQQHYIGAIRNSSEDLLRIVNDILDYSKIESGQYTFQHQAFNLQHVLSQIYQTFEAKAKEKELDLEFVLSEEIPGELIGDAVRLKQILGNLVANAIKFTASGSVTLTVECLYKSESDVRLRFVVSDTGIGIDPEKIEQVFESFNQVSSEDAAAKGGTGLGLSICKQLVEQQGGHIALKSKPGAGTDVSVELSFERAVGTAASAPFTLSPDLSAFRNCRILLVEDTYFNQLLATELLSSKLENAHIEIAENGQIALEKAMQSAFDLILMDIKMPIMDGLEATRRLRASDATRNIPIIGLTASAVPEELEKCRLAGMDRWITKPIRSAELMNAIYHVLSDKRQLLSRDEKN